MISFLDALEEIRTLFGSERVFWDIIKVHLQKMLKLQMIY